MDSHLCWATTPEWGGLTWSVVDIHSDILLEKIDFPLPESVICEQLLG